MQLPKMPDPNDALPSSDEDSSDEARARQRALVWIRQALSDIDRAMESENIEVAQALLHRVQDVLDMLGAHRASSDTHRISEIRALVDRARKRKA
jgi:hypothetical protein